MFERLIRNLFFNNFPQNISADDSPFNANLIYHDLSQFETSGVSTVYNGRDAFLKYKECKVNHADIDIVTLDIGVPVMDGRIACDKIREYEREHKMKPTIVILISGNYDKEQIGDYLNPPNKGHLADCFLRKPVSFSEFHRAVYSLVIQD